MLTTMASLGGGRDSGSPLPLPLALTAADRRHYHHVLHPSHHHHHHNHHHHHQQHHHHQLLASPYDPIRRLALARLPPPRRPVANKPFTSFCIKDILGGEVDKEDIGNNSNKSISINNNNNNSGSNNSNSRDTPPASKSRTVAKSVANKSRSQNSSGSNNNSSSTTTNLDILISSSTTATNSNNNHNNNNSVERTRLTAVSPSRSYGPHLSPSSRVHVPAVSLNGARIVRPWVPSPGSPDTELSSDDGGDAYQDVDNEDEEEDEEEISVDDDEPSPRLGAKGGKSGVSPLDALMAMTSKTFEGLEAPDAADARRRDQAALFGKHAPPKKRRKSRTAFTNQQIYELEKRFLYQKYLTPADRDEIAHSLGLTNAQVITWFQNRRAKLKRDLEELKNDVTAARKHPVHKALMGTMAELQLRKVHSDVLKKAAAAAAAAEAAESGSGNSAASCRSGDRPPLAAEGRCRESSTTSPPSSPSSCSAAGPSPSPQPLALTTSGTMSPSCHSNSSSNLSNVSGGCLRCASASPTGAHVANNDSKTNSGDSGLDRIRSNDSSCCGDIDRATAERSFPTDSPRSLDGQDPEGSSQDMDTSEPMECEVQNPNDPEERDKPSFKSHDS